MVRKLIPVAILAMLLLAVAACSNDESANGTPELSGGYPIPQDQELVTQGIGLYTNNCAHCHGTGTQSPLTQNTPSHGPDGHTWHHPDQMLVSWILDGVPAGVTMPRFRGQLTEQEVRAVVAYIKTFWTDTQRQQQRTMSSNFEQNYR